MPKNLDQLRKGKEFISHAEKKGAKIRQGKGSHTVVEYNNESFVILCIMRTWEKASDIRL